MNTIESLLEDEVITQTTMEKLLCVFDFDEKNLLSFIEFFSQKTVDENLDSVILWYLELYTTYSETKKDCDTILKTFDY